MSTGAPARTIHDAPTCTHRYRWHAIRRLMTSGPWALRSVRANDVPITTNDQDSERIAERRRGSGCRKVACQLDERTSPGSRRRSSDQMSVRVPRGLTRRNPWGPARGWARPGFMHRSTRIVPIAAAPGSSRLRPCGWFTHLSHAATTHWLMLTTLVEHMQPARDANRLARDSQNHRPTRVTSAEPTVGA